MRLFATLLLFVSLLVRASDHTAAGTSAAQVQAAIDACVDGDRAIVPAGTSSWTSQVRIVNKSITLQGNGVGSTVITIDIANTQTTGLMSDCRSSKFVTIKGFTFKTVQSRVYGIVSFEPSSPPNPRCMFMIGDCRFEITPTGGSTDAYRGIVTFDAWGLIYNCYFKNTGSGGQAVTVDTLYNQSAMEIDWKQPHTYGTTNSTVIEDCQFDYTGQGDGCLDAYGGAKFTFRHNVVTNTPLAWHGADSGQRSARAFEIYNNFFTGANEVYPSIRSRGGTGVIYSNTVAGVIAWVLLSHYRADPAYGTPPGASYDGNFNATYPGQGFPTGYPLLDQTGRGSLPAGTPSDAFARPTGGSYTTNTYLSNEPLYIWNNDVRGNTSPTTEVDNPTQSQTYIHDGRDYFDNTPKPSYTALVYPHPFRSTSTSPPNVTSPTTATATNYIAFTYSITTDAAVTSYGFTNLPNNNLTGNTNTGVISGSPTNAGGNVQWTNTYGLRATNSNGSAAANLVLVSMGLPNPVITSATNLSGTVGFVFNYQITAVNYPLSYSISGLPSGLSLDTVTGIISGTPLAQTTNNGTMTANNAIGSGNKAYQIIISPVYTGNAWYVATNGVDAVGRGSISQPFATINYGLGRIGGGDTLYIRTGTYNEDGFYFYAPAGSAGSPTTIRNYPGETVFFVGTGDTGRIAFDGTSYVTLDGLDISILNNGPTIRNGAHHITVRNCTVHSIGQEAVRVKDNCHDILIENNSIHDTAVLGSQFNGEGIYLGSSLGDNPTDFSYNLTARSNTIYNTFSEGIEVKHGVHEALIEANNVATNNTGGTAASSIEIDESVWSSNPNHVVTRNVVHNSGANSHGIRAGTGCLVYDNIVYGINGAKNGIQIDNNNSDSYTRKIYWNTVDVPSARAVVTSSGATDIRNNIGPNTAGNIAINSAYFVNYAGRNYLILSGSAPENAGVNINGIVPYTDILGLPRFSGLEPDLGAYELQSEGIPKPNNTIRITITRRR